MNPANTFRPAFQAPSLVSLLVVAVLFLCPLLIYFGTASSLVTIWNSSETYAHGYIILPISVWLIWRKRAVLAQTPVQPFWPGLGLLLLAGLGWLLAEVGDIQVIRQYCFVAFIPLLALTVFGRELFRIILFPLFFLMLAVPFGDFLIEPLIGFTADFTVTALQITGIAVLRNGSSFSIPSGDWSVVDACSGLRYLISSITLGCLYAYLSYNGWKKRILFVLAAVIMPVIANGLRAYMIVMIGHLSSMTLAVGIDHLIYGWLFFGLVIYILFWIGNFWRDSQPAPTPAPANGTSIQLPLSGRASWLHAAGCALVCLALFPAIDDFIEHANHNPQAVSLNGYDSQWTALPGFVAWQPHYLPAAAELDESLGQDGRRVRLVLKYYRNQIHGAELISSVNTMVVDNDASWRKTVQSDRLETVTGAGPGLPLHETQLTGNQHLLIWSINWINGRFIGSRVTAKLNQTWDKLTLQGDDGAAIILAAPFADNPEEARQTLRLFLSTDLARLEAVLNANRSRQ